MQYTGYETYLDQEGAHQDYGQDPTGSVVALPQTATEKLYTAIPMRVPIVGAGLLGGGWLGGMAAEATDMDPWMGRLVGGGLGAAAAWAASRVRPTKVSGDAYGAVSYARADTKWKEWKGKLKRYEKNTFKSGPLRGKVKDPLGRDIAKAKVREWKKKRDRATDKPAPKAPAAPPKAPAAKPDVSLPPGATDFPAPGVGPQMGPPLPPGVIGPGGVAARGGPPEEAGWFAAPMWGDGPSRGIVIGSSAGVLVAGGLIWWLLSRRGGEDVDFEEDIVAEEYEPALEAV